MKKQLAIGLAVILLLGCLLLPAHAETPAGAIAVRLRSDVAGCSSAEYSRLIEIVSGNAVYSFFSGGPVSAADYAGTAESGKLVAGRTYSLTYLLEAAPGYTLPDALGAGDLSVDCGKGVSVTSKQIVSVSRKTADGAAVPFKGLQITAQVVVDGSVLQRIAGFFTDVFLKIKAWSLY